MLHPIPTLPATIGQFIFRYEFQGRWQRNVFYFRGPATLAAGWVFRDWWNEAAIWLINAQQFTLPRDFGQYSFWAFYNTGAFTHSDGTPKLTPNYAPFDSYDPALCPCYTKRSNPGRHGYGRMHGPALHDDMLDNNGNYKAVYLNFFNNCALQMNAPFFWLGQTYIPVHYSPALGTYSTMSYIKFLHRPSYLRRRKVGRDRPSDLWDYPVIP